MRGFPALVAILLLLQGCAAIVRGRLYHPEPLPQLATSWRGAAPQEVVATSSDGIRLKGFYWPPSRPDGRLIIFFHGNGGNHVISAQRAAPLASVGDGVLVASYRGYGDNSGKPTEHGLIRVGEAFLQLARMLVPQSHVYFFGHSLGGAVALQLAAREQVAGVITLGAFTAVTDLAPSFARAFIADRFDNLKAIDRVEEPILIIHGNADTIVPFTHAERLRAAASGRARLLQLAGADHHPDFAELAPLIRANLDEMPKR